MGIFEYHAGYSIPGGTRYQQALLNIYLCLLLSYHQPAQIMKQCKKKKKVSYRSYFASSILNYNPFRCPNFNSFLSFWSNHSSCHICTAGDDHQALIWDIQQMPRAIEDPILAYTAAEGEVNQIQWGATQPDWIAICYNKACEILRV